MMCAELSETWLNRAAWLKALHRSSWELLASILVKDIDGVSLPSHNTARREDVGALVLKLCYLG